MVHKRRKRKRMDGKVVLAAGWYGAEEERWECER